MRQLHTAITRYEALLREGKQEAAKTHGTKRDNYIVRIDEASEKLKALTVKYEAVMSIINSKQAADDFTEKKKAFTEKANLHDEKFPVCNGYSFASET